MVQATANAAAGRWKIVQERDPLNDSLLTELFLQSDSTFNGNAVELELRCVNHRTELMVFAGAVVSGSREGRTLVRYRFDGGAPITAEWYEGTSRQAIYAPDPVPLARRMAQSRQFRIEYHPTGDSLRTMSYHTGKLHTVIDTVAHRCRWDE